MRLDPFPRFPADPGLVIRKLTDMLRETSIQVNGVSEGRIASNYNALTAAPTTGAWQKGDVVRNTNPVETGTAPNAYVVYGWLCTVAGEPGTWIPLNVPVAGFGANPTESMVVACSDETTALTAGTAKVTFRIPYAFTLTGVKASLTTAQTSGSIFTVDLNEGGTSVLSTKLTIDNTEKTSATAATAAVISDSSIADDAEMTIDIDQIGDGTAKGLKVTLIGKRT